MIKIIDGVAYERKIDESAWLMSLHSLGHGQHEALIQRPMVMVDADWSKQRIQDHLEMLETLPRDPDADRRNAERSARRAKTKVRRICKSMGVDALLTLTYRDNMQDLAAAKAHLKAFVRRLRALVPGFAYVAAFERQKRGAWHIHMAIHALPFNLPWAGVKVKSYSVVRAVWRSVVGSLGGNIDQARKKRHSRKSPAQMASYISKYILKAFEDGEDYSNRYSSSAYSLPDAVRMRFVGASLADLIPLVYDEIGQNNSTNPWLSRWGDRFFLVSEPAPPPHNLR